CSGRAYRPPFPSFLLNNRAILPAGSRISNNHKTYTGVSVMRKPWFHLSLLASACLSASALAQEAVKSGNWSDASTWAGGAVPRAGGLVTIASGVDVVLDTNTPALGGMTINGKLRFSDAADVELSTEWIMLHGELEI